jgi:cytochrome c biogenesis protein CcdA
VLFGTSLLASFLGGMVALFAPCCVSVMLPAYLATGMRRRAGILAATLVFAAGVATVIVPIGLGASAITALVSGHHLVVFLAGGVLMALGGIAVLAGWSPRLPMPGGRAPSGNGWAATYGLGVFSGAASSCCAPVLAGVAVLSGATASFPAALAVSLTYVAGMTVPLCLLALVWDRGDGRAARVLHRRELHLHLGTRTRTLSLGTLASGLLMIVMGGLTIVIAFTGPAMNSGWQVRTGAWLDHVASVATKHLGFLPGWALLVLLVGFAVLVVRGLRRPSRNERVAEPELPPVAAACCTPDPLTTAVAASGRADIDE